MQYQSWCKGGTTVLLGGAGERRKIRKRGKGEGETALPSFQLRVSYLVAGKVPSTSGFRCLNTTLYLFLRCFLMKGLTKGHFHFSREYCEHKNVFGWKSVLQTNWFSVYLSVLVSISAIGTSPFLARVRLGLLYASADFSESTGKHIILPWKNSAVYLVTAEVSHF